MAYIIESYEEFDTKILWSDTGVVLVDFFADWCGPCRVIAPLIEELAAENIGKATLYKVDIDELPQLASEYEIFSIPTVLLFKNGVLVWEPLQWVLPKEVYQEMIDHQFSQ